MGGGITRRKQGWVGGGLVVVTRMLRAYDVRTKFISSRVDIMCESW